MSFLLDPLINWLLNVGYLCLRGYNIQTQHQGQVWIQYLAQG